MLNGLNNIVNFLNGYIWGVGMLVLIVGSGLYFTIRLHGFQFVHFKDMWSRIIDKQDSDSGISAFGSFCTTMAMRVGTGNVAGVAVAIYMGGPGALFWMILAGMTNSAVCFAECTLAVLYKTRIDGQYRGGGAYCAERGLGWKKYGAFMALILMIGTSVFMPAAATYTICDGFHNAIKIPMWVSALIIALILAVVVIYWNKLIPLSTKHGLHISRRKCKMWVKIIVASIPAGVVGILWDDVFTKYFYNYQTVAIMLILVGVVFIIIERSNKNKIARVDSIDDISYGQAFMIGVFQMIAAIFPGTSRSGSTIVGSLMLGISRTVAAEFTFFLAVPAMFGGSAIKILKYSGGFNSAEVALLAIGMIVAFVLSIIAIKFLMSYIKKHDFKVFGWYRIVLGIAVIGYFLATR